MRIWIALIAMVLCSSCDSALEYEEGPYSIRLETIHDSLHVLRLSVEGTETDTLVLPYEVYQFDCGDLTGDGNPEVCVGVIKSTRYWPRGKRLFIYKLYHGRWIRPLWLGSKVGNLESFRVERDSVPARIITNEAQYRYQGFGLKFERSLPTPKMK